MDSELPYFSVVVPTFARPRRLAACLQSLSAVEYPRDRLQVIVVDDGGPESLDPVVAPFRDALRISLVVQHNQGPAAARNHGARRACGDMLVFTDDDCTAEPGWLAALARCAAAAPGEMIGGRIVNALEHNPYAATSQALVSFLYAYHNPLNDNARFFASSNMAVPARRFADIGGFDTSFPLAAGEDRDLCDRWLHHGFAMRYEPAAVILHAHCLRLTSFVRQHFGYGRGAYHFHQARARRGEGRIELEPLSFYLGLLQDPAPARQPRWRHACLMLLTQCANAGGFFWEALARRKKLGTHII